MFLGRSNHFNVVVLCALLAFSASSLLMGGCSGADDEVMLAVSGTVPDAEGNPLAECAGRDRVPV